jgi:hypothetical protein
MVVPGSTSIVMLSMVTFKSVGCSIVVADLCYKSSKIANLTKEMKFLFQKQTLPPKGFKKLGLDIYF